jgi:hypothetical protein
MNSSGTQCLDVGKNCRVLPHFSVHRRCNQNWSLGGKDCGTEKVTGETARELRYRMSRGGSNNDEVCPLAKSNVANLSNTLK